MLKTKCDLNEMFDKEILDAVENEKEFSTDVRFDETVFYKNALEILEEEDLSVFVNYIDEAEHEFQQHCLINYILDEEDKITERKVLYCALKRFDTEGKHTPIPLYLAKSLFYLMEAAAWVKAAQNKEEPKSWLNAYGKAAFTGREDSESFLMTVRKHFENALCYARLLW